GKLGQNLKYAQHALANHGIVLRGCAHDTELESYVLESHKPHDLESLARRHLDLPTIDYDAVTGKGVHRISFDQVAIDRATTYAAENADVTLRVHRHLAAQIEADPKLSHVYTTIELPVREVLFRMERTGVLVDADVLNAQGRDLGERVNALEQEAHRLAGTPFNLGSPKQLCEILFDRMKLPVRKKTATGQPSTDEEVLQELAADYPLPKLLLEYRALSKLKSTYTDKLPTMVNSRTGRVHTTFSQTTAVTGRLASIEPNLQNIPIRTPDGRRIREAFIAPPGHALLSADYSQIELRIMAHLSEDPALLRAFKEGDDIHRVTAAEIFGVPPADVTADQRRYIKAVNFGLIYGMSAFGLATQLNIERSAAAQFIERYFTRYPGVAAYMQRTRELAREQGYVETVFGRRLFLPDIRAASGPRRSGAERAAINAPMQGTAADLIKLAMIAVQRYLDEAGLGTRLILQVHDELVLEAPAEELERVTRDLPDLMTSVATLRVPLKVDLGTGPNWEQAHS
ncbi:MAG TPA: DNA polymerase I, partial [Casimicrobiaceae bacterium]|nr:DNA polymerase I [Casimicrobiaceae bacterium]